MLGDCGGWSAMVEDSQRLYEELGDHGSMMATQSTVDGLSSCV